MAVMQCSYMKEDGYLPPRTRLGKTRRIPSLPQPTYKQCQNDATRLLLVGIPKFTGAQLIGLCKEHS